nr:MAG TPA: hypothetical protein [Caudoviricetes sp.]
MVIIESVSRASFYHTTRYKTGIGALDDSTGKSIGLVIHDSSGWSMGLVIFPLW